VGTATTAVTFLPLDQAEINAYVTSGEWVDKAGGYAIQGLAGLFVSALRGEYSNVVGLPLCLLARLFRECGFDLLRRQWI
jgi:septum formation protein